MATDDLFPSWNELSSNGLMAILDNGPSIVDRFTAVFLDGSALSFAAKPNEQPGISQWTSGGIGAHRVFRDATAWCGRA